VSGKSRFWLVGSRHDRARWQRGGGRGACTARGTQPAWQASRAGCIARAALPPATLERAPINALPHLRNAILLLLAQRALCVLTECRCIDLNSRCKRCNIKLFAIFKQKAHYELMSIFDEANVPQKMSQTETQPVSKLIR